MIKMIYKNLIDKMYKFIKMQKNYLIYYLKMNNFRIYVKNTFKIKFKIY